MTEIKPDFEITADSSASVASETVKRELTPEERLWEMEDSLDSFKPFAQVVDEVDDKAEEVNNFIDEKVTDVESTVEKFIEEPVAPQFITSSDDDDSDIYIEPAETEEEASKVLDIDDEIPVFAGTEPVHTLDEADEEVNSDSEDDIFVEDTVSDEIEEADDELNDEDEYTIDDSDDADDADRILTIDGDDYDDSYDYADMEDDSDTDGYSDEDDINPYVSDAPSYFLGGGDTLLAQIDAFREKAMQLASMINEKESKAKELEGVVASYEEKNRLLEEELNAKQEEADSLKTDVESQVNRLLSSLKTDMNKMGVDISDRVAACTMNINTDDITASVSDYFDKVISAVNDSKDELVEKYHSENVRLYRNVQDLMKELDNSDEIILKSQQQYESLKTRFGIVTGLLILNFFIAVCVLILSLNII